MESSLDNGNDTTSDDTPTRHSSKLSLGSSPSVLSGDDEDGDYEVLKNDPSGNSNDEYDDQDPLSPIQRMTNAKDKAHMDNNNNNNNHVFDGSLPTFTINDEFDDIHLEHDSASPLSSVPDDFPLSPETQDDSLLFDSPIIHQQLQSETTSQPHTTIQDDTTHNNNNNNNNNNNSKTRKRKRRSRNKGGQYQSSKQNNLPSNNDENDSNGQDVSQQTIKSKRVSIHGRTIYTKSTLNTKSDTHVEEEEEDDNEETDNNNNNNNMNEMTNNNTKQIPLAPTKHHHNTTSTTRPLSKIKSAVQQPGSNDDDNVQQDTDEEKENTPVISNENNGDIHLTNDFSGPNNIIHTNPLEYPENLPTNEEELDDQQQRKEAFDALTHIEMEFARLREKLYQEKMAELNDEALMIANGTHPNLVTLMMEIEEKKGRRISTAEAWRKNQHDNFKRQFEGFEYQANVNFISRKSSMRRKVLAEMNGKRWRLEDERRKLINSSHKHGNLIPDINVLTTRKQGKREETMDLRDIKDVIGFPRAPPVTGLSARAIRDDLQLLGLGTSGSH